MSEGAAQLAPYREELSRVTGVPHDLPPAQQDVLSILFNSGSITDAAKSAEVSRGTIYYWFKTDARFQAIYKLWFDSVRRSTKSRLMALSEVAAENVDEAVRNGNTKISVQLLKGIGFFNGKHEESPFDIELIDREENVKRNEAKLKLYQREMALFKSKPELLGQIPRDPFPTAGVWAVIPIPVPPLTGLDLHRDLPRLHHAFIYDGNPEDPVLFIKCIDQGDQNLLVKELARMGYDTLCPYSPDNGAEIRLLESQQPDKFGAPNEQDQSKQP